MFYKGFEAVGAIFRKIGLGARFWVPKHDFQGSEPGFGGLAGIWGSEPGFGGLAGISGVGQGVWPGGRSGSKKGPKNRQG